MSSGIPGQGKSYPYWPATYGDNGGGLPIGAVSMFAGTVAPQNYLFCLGQNLLISQYNAVYRVIGNAFSSGQVTPQGLFCSDYLSDGTNITFNLHPNQVNFSIQVGDTLRVSDFTVVSTPSLNGNTFEVIDAPPIGTVGGAIVVNVGTVPGTLGAEGTNGNITRINFSLPNITDRFVLGSNQIGTTGGTNSIQILAENLPQHRHGVFRGVATNVQQTEPTVNVQGADPNVNNDDLTIIDATYDNTGTVLVENTRIDVTNPFITLQYIIKYA